MALLDGIEDNHGSRQADLVLTVVRSIMRWYATRVDDYAPPVVAGMRRQNPKEHTRARILDDSEIAAVWKAAGTAGTFGAILRFCLLTGQRSRKVVSLRWSDVSIDGEWVIAAAPREKTSAGSLMLPAAALSVIHEQPRIGQNPYVFCCRGNGPFNGYSHSKKRFDAMLPGVGHWTIHDARRTSRSLMSRAGVRPDIAERIMGHAVGGIEATYDRHAYTIEKRDALAKLAALIDAIVNARDNVTPMTATRRGP